MTFRRRLTIWSTLVAAVSLLLCGAVAAWYVHAREMEELDASLESETVHFFAELKAHGGPAFNWTKINNEMREWLPLRQPSRFMEIRDGSLVRWRSGDPGEAVLPEADAGWGEITRGDSRIRFYAEERNGITFAIGEDLRYLREKTRGLMMATLAGLPLALGFAWLGGRKLAALAVAPVEKMTAAAERVTAEHLDQRVPVPPVLDEIRRHAEVLNATFDRLERSYKQALRFSADASHELKTPLTVLRASIEATLDSPALGDNDRAAISALLDQTHRLTSIISGLLLLARADAGRLVLDFGAHDLAALTGACVEDASIVADPRRIRVESTLPREAPGRIDPIRFSQILSNLLDNAVKYNQEGGEVRVSLKDAGDTWRLSIANTGPGIAPEHQARLFERFFRAEHTAEESGQGLGLSLARELARAHGGDVVLVRSGDGWTEFAITLPKTDTAPAR